MYSGNFFSKVIHIFSRNLWSFFEFNTMNILKKINCVCISFLFVVSADSFSSFKSLPNKVVKYLRKNEVPELLKKKLDILFDDEKVQRLIIFGYPKEYVIKSLEEMDPNYCTAGYYLMGMDQNYC